MSHVQTRNKQVEDVVRDKGKGLVLLLHGTCGKGRGGKGAGPEETLEKCFGLVCFSEVPTN